MSITLRKIRSGDATNIIVINGFLSEEKTDVNDWLSVLGGSFKTMTAYHYDWEACNISTLFNSIINSDVTQLVKEQKSIDILDFFSLFINSSLLTHKEWSRAMKNSKIAGVDLAEYIDNQDKTFSLIGHSLGASVIYYCLESLKSKEKIKDAFLLGGAIDENINWSKLLQSNSKLNIFNCYSDSDYVLKNFYSMGTDNSIPIGLTPIKQSNSDRLHNINMSKVSLGHMEYKTSFVGQVLEAHMLDPNGYSTLRFSQGIIKSIFNIFE